MSIAREAQPTPYYFISYSRQEVAFADSFSRELEKCGLHSWIDFRNLVPGHSWQQQLDEAIRTAAAILLVVSKVSMASQSVQDEWRTALVMDRRIILIIFEPTKLDPDLTVLEWVDFTGNFEQAMIQLVGILAHAPQKMTSMPPQRWIRLPKAARRFITHSILLVVMSIIGGCSVLFMVPSSEENLVPAQFPDLVIDLLCASGIFIWLPAIFIFTALPLQFLRRTHNAQTIRNALSALIAASLLLLIVQPYATLEGGFSSKEFSIYVYLCCSTPSLLITLVTCLRLNRLLVSKEMYRWSGPTGTLTRSVRPDLTGRTASRTPLRVLVESAPQDLLYARELKVSITTVGHICTDDPQTADIVLPLLSVYKTDSIFDPETTRMIPILIQRCDVTKRLSRMQWVDLRYGKASMDAVANLLDEPNKLLGILGVLPVRTMILPDGIKWLAILLSFFLNVFLVLCLLFSWGPILSDRNSEVDLVGPLIIFIFTLGLYFLRLYIVYRKLRYLPFLSYWWAVGFAVLLALPLLLFPPFGFSLFLIPLLMLRKDVKLWLPS